MIRIGVLAALLGGLARTWADPDLWGHVKFGGDIVRDGLPRTDPYSFTSDIPWVNHEWLAEVLMYAAWRAAGGGGLIALKMAIVCGTLGCLLLTLRNRQMPTVVFDLAVVTTIFGLWPRVFVIRPQLFSVLLFAALLWGLSTAERARAARLWLLPLLFALWVNLHGGWIVGIGALLLWAAATLGGLGMGQIPKRAVIGLLALSALATLANPYGTGLMTFLGHTVRPDRPNINDWRPLWESDAQVIVPWLITAGFTVAAIARGRSRIPMAHGLIVLALGAASVRVNRLDVFFTLSAVMLLTPWLALPTKEQPKPTWSRVVIVPGAVVALLLVAGAWRLRADLTCPRLDGPWMPEREAGAFIVANGLEGRLLTWFDWGQYAIWHFSPMLKVSLDGRRETVYSDTFVAQHLRLYFQPEISGDMLPRLAPDYAWIPRDIPLAGLLDRSGWHRRYEGPISVVFGREPLAGPSAPILASPACFPGP